MAVVLGTNRFIKQVVQSLVTGVVLSTAIAIEAPIAKAASLIQNDLFFGRSIPGGGQVSEEQFQDFVDNEITPNFPGLTVFDTQGRVQDEAGNIRKELSKVVTLILENTPESATAVSKVLGAYQQRFEGAGVLQVTNKDDLTVSFDVNPDDLIVNDATPEVVQADLYLGRSISGGSEVSELEFQEFVDDVISPSFSGLTVFDAEGQFLDDTGSVIKEPSKVATLLFEDTQQNEDALKEVIAAYVNQFQQQGALQTINEDIAVSFGLAEDLIDNDPTPEPIQADLYFGLNIPEEGEVSREEFLGFVDEVIAPSFPGLTVYNAQGQVQDEAGNITREQSQLITLILEDTTENEAALNQVLEAYQDQFQGAGVLQVIDEDVRVVPESSSTVGLLVSGVIGIIFLRRRLKTV